MLSAAHVEMGSVCVDIKLRGRKIEFDDGCIREKSFIIPSISLFNVWNNCLFI